jgi:hypothetical protein
MSTAHGRRADASSPIAQDALASERYGYEPRIVSAGRHELKADRHARLVARHGHRDRA